MQEREFQSISDKDYEDFTTHYEDMKISEFESMIRPSYNATFGDIDAVNKQPSPPDENSISPASSLDNPTPMSSEICSENSDNVVCNNSEDWNIQNENENFEKHGYGSKIDDKLENLQDNNLQDENFDVNVNHKLRKLDNTGNVNDFNTQNQDKNNKICVKDKPENFSNTGNAKDLNIQNENLETNAEDYQLENQCQLFDNAGEETYTKNLESFDDEQTFTVSRFKKLFFPSGHKDISPLR